MFEVGDSVVVKQGVRDVDFDVDIGGWRGRIEEIEPGEDGRVLLVHWDSVTLREMSDAIVEACEEQGLSWTTYYVETSDVQPSSPRDTEEDVSRVVKELERKHAWIWIGPEGRTIREVLDGVDPRDIVAALDAWNCHLEERLDFPFEAEVDVFRERGPLRGGDRVTVVGISGLDYTRGVIVHLQRSRQWYDSPLCDLSVADRGSPNHHIVQAYRIWFANR
jgi:hypothetical protein